MTSGKSTIGPILANVLGWHFYDLDKVIVDEQGMSIVDIFEKYGEEHFRKVETDTLRRKSNEEKTVIALGGGTMTRDENVEILKSSGTVIYLRATIDVIYERLKNKIDRPAFRDLVLNGSTIEQFKEKIAQMLKDREPYYMKSDIIINTNQRRIGLTVDEIAKKMTKLLNEKNPN